MLGVRESRRIMGDYVMTMEDVVEGNRPDDTVAMGGYHIDIHRPAGTWVESYNVRTYGVPLRSLIARDVEGLLMAGKWADWLGIGTQLVGTQTMSAPWTAQSRHVSGNQPS